MEVTRLFDLAAHYHKTYPKPDAFAAKENGKWKTYSTAEFVETVNNFSYGLLAMGLQPGDKIGMLSNNRPEWNFADLGMLQAGVINVPIYPTISDNDLQFILNDAEIKYVIVSSKDLYTKVKAATASLPFVKDIYMFNNEQGMKNWSEILELGKKNADKAKLDMVSSKIQNGDLATILYTSGTTGTPKGVMLSHNNLLSNVFASRHLMPTDQSGKALSFLPLNHVYERMLTYVYMYLGISVYYAESLETIGDNLKEIKPDVFSCVPRLLEKVYDKIVAKGADLTGIKKKLFFWALELGEKYDPNKNLGFWYNFQLNLANKIIFSKWREALGGNVKCAISGGAALHPRLARIFWAARIPILEGYGLTETSPVIAVNNLEPGGMKVATVGPLLKNVQVKIAEDGEILAKGPNIMMGYYKRPDATAEVLDSEGWFHTGDIGVLEDGKYLKITDRKKEIFKTSGGKYIVPQSIENKLRESRFIEQAMICGENQKYASALIVPAFAFLKEWCSRKGVNCPNNEELIKHPEVIARMKEEVEKVNKSLAQYETIKKFELLPREWAVDKGELTPKLSLRRKVILEKNKALVDKMYAGAESVMA
jgi:long-chain acyl-CoA synthetase